MAGASLMMERRARRGQLPRVIPLGAVEPAPEGMFRLGLAHGGGELSWDPWGVDPPHLLIAGATESGKSRMMETLAIAALTLWGWDVRIVDFKGGGDYHAAVTLGAVVHPDPASAVAAMRECAELVAERNAVMRELEIRRPAEDVPGMDVLDRATTLRQLDPETRAGLGWRPVLMLIDETASLMAEKKAGGPEALTRGVQLGRSAGMHIVLGMQRPDATLLDGFVKHNVRGRVLLGESDPVTDGMVIGPAMSRLDEDVLAEPRPPGRGVATGIGGRGAALFHAYLLRRDAYLRHVPAGASALPPAPDASGSAAPGSALADDPVEGGSGAPGALAGVPAHSLALPVGEGGSPQARTLAPPSPLAAIAVRLLRGPAVRVALRVGAQRSRVGPLLDGPFVRDRALVAAVRERDGHRCRCGAGPPVDVDHRRPLWNGGADAPGNMRSLCRPCHAAKTSAERRILDRRRRARRARERLGSRARRLPAWPPEVWTWGAVFLTGVATSRWLAYGLALALGASLGPPLLRGLGRWALGAVTPRGMLLVARRRGPGLDGADTLDARIESDSPGFFGRLARTYWRSRRRMVALRWGLALTGAAYLAGVGAREQLPGLLLAAL